MVDPPLHKDFTKVHNLMIWGDFPCSVKALERRLKPFKDVRNVTLYQPEESLHGITSRDLENKIKLRDKSD
jgi:hypothetical protein